MSRAIHRIYSDRSVLLTTMRQRPIRVNDVGEARLIGVEYFCRVVVGLYFGCEFDDKLCSFVDDFVLIPLQAMSDKFRDAPRSDAIGSLEAIDPTL